MHFWSPLPCQVNFWVAGPRKVLVGGRTGKSGGGRGAQGWDSRSLPKIRKYFDSLIANKGILVPVWFHISLVYAWVIVSVSTGGTVLCHIPLANPSMSAGQSPHFQRLTWENGLQRPPISAESRRRMGFEFDWAILILLPFAEILTHDPVAMGTLYAPCCHTFM